MSAAFEELLPGAVRASAAYRCALTHRSAGAPDNERLEFLGDAVLDLLVSEELYARFPELPEGALTQMRAHLVSGRMLGELAAQWGIGELVRMDIDLPQARAKAAGNALEAIVAAAYLEAGLPAAHALVRALYGARLSELTGPDAVRSAKALLQEVLQRQGLAVPRYDLIEQEGQAASGIRFTVRCAVPELALAAEGVGPRIRDAEADASARMLAEIRRQHPAW